MSNPFRVLFTGSRIWDDRTTLGQVMSSLLVDHGQDNLICVHGDCPKGLDLMVRNYCAHNKIKQEAHPADWGKGRGAGPIRNQLMVDLGADLCLAFLQGESRGTRDCATRARRAGIKVVYYGDESTPDSLW